MRREHRDPADASLSSTGQKFFCFNCSRTVVAGSRGSYIFGEANVMHCNHTSFGLALNVSELSRRGVEHNQLPPPTASPLGFDLNLHQQDRSSSED